jgi:hypothetical protein
MSRNAFIACALGVIFISGEHSFAHAQSASPASERPRASEVPGTTVTKDLKVWERNLHKTVEAKAARHAACVKQAKQQGLHFYNRRRFMKQCMVQRPS